ATRIETKRRPRRSLRRRGRLVARLLRRFQVVQAVELLLSGVARRPSRLGIAGEEALDALEGLLVDRRRLVLRARDVGQTGALRVRVGQAVAARLLVRERRTIVAGIGRRAGAGREQRQREQPDSQLRTQLMTNVRHDPSSLIRVTAAGISAPTSP